MDSRIGITWSGPPLSSQPHKLGPVVDEREPKAYRYRYTTFTDGIQHQTFLLIKGELIALMAQYGNVSGSIPGEGISFLLFLAADHP